MWRVIWMRAAGNGLAAASLTHGRAAVADASHRIDQALARDPENQGEERPPDRRIMFDPPLVVVYRVDRANRRVIVSSCRAF